ncbi:hypothetical protein GCM10023229_31940 [Flavisolibacter ginsenosidimutans]
MGKWGSTEDGADLLIMKVNARGEQLWAKKIVVSIRLDEYELTEMSDGSLVFVGDSQYNTAPTNSDMLLIKFTCQGDVVWSKNLSMTASVPHRFLMPYSIKEGKNNDAIISFYGVNSVQYTVVCRVDSAGNLVWSKTFYGTDNQTQLPSVAFVANDKIFVFGFKSLFQNSFLYNKSFFAIQLDYNTGATLVTKGYNYSEFITNYGILGTHPKIHFYAEQLANGGFALFGVFSNFSQQTGYFFKLLLRPDLSIDKATAFSVAQPTITYWSKISVLPNGQTHIVCANYDSRTFYWYAVDSLQNKIREQKTPYPNTYIDLRYAVAQSGLNRSLCVLSTMNATAAANGSIEIIQAEDNDAGMLPCLGTDTSFVKVVPWSVLSGTMQWQSVKDNEAVLSPLQFTSTAIPVTSQYVCEPVAAPPSSGQASIKITGKDTICFNGPVRQYVAHRINQSAPVTWLLDSSKYGTLSTLNDSTVSIAFTNQLTRPTTLKLYAYAGTCTVTQDSLNVTLLPPNLKLSANVNTCNPPFTLHPGPWFNTYLWQDGSTDSTFTVTQPGLYYVTLTDGCGNVIHDSLRVSGATIDIGPDRTKCNTDTIHLDAPAGFLSYSWSPAYNISSITGASVVVNPSVDTTYFVKAGNGPGCFANDTVRITVRKSPPISFGPDVSLCSGDSLTLDAGVGFSTYHWNTGAVGQTLLVKSTGTYSVTGTTIDGCRSSDTLQILQMFPRPQVQLNKNPTLCEGEISVLDAGAFAAYLWQDGSTARSFTATTIGTYSVRVTDNNNCTASDTTVITTIYPSPKNFIASDTAFCLGEKLELKPLTNYPNYAWSTGASTPSLTISQPGIYWLRVQDNNGCRGTDSISVSVKNCIASFFVPTGFTPNGDGKNDDFHPVLTGVVKNYRFTIYNRWGQVVFQTTDLKKGWNGKIGDIPQATGVFVWICSYQFEGEETKTAKGSVVLIR